MIQVVGPQFTQWDIGRSVKVLDSTATHIHFANKGDSTAVIIEIKDKTAKIPDYLFQTGKDIVAYAVLDGVTLERKSFFITKRERPENYVYEEDRRNYIYELITGAEEATAAANEATDKANEAAQNAAQASEAASVSAVTASEAANNANDAAYKAAQTAKSLMIIGKVEGDSIHLDDAAEQYLVSGRVFGKTTQAGAPTPAAPVDLVSSVDGDSLSIHVNSKNLFTGWEAGGIHTGNGIEITGDDKRRTGFLPVFEPGQKICFSGIPNTMNSFAAFYNSDKEFISRSPGNATVPRVVDVPDGAKYFRFTIYESASLSGKISEADAMVHLTMIEAGSIATGYERGNAVQAATISVPNGLRGIPVTAGGNYTDENGQQWVCDEIDLDRGVYVKRIGRVTLTGTESWLGYFVDGVTNQFHTASPVLHASDECGAMCAYYKPIAINDRGGNFGTVYTYASGIAFNTLECATIDEWKALLAQRNTTVLYKLATPVETALAAEEIAAFAALYTHRQKTIVSNDGFAHMEIEYVMDAKKYIDSIIKGSAGWIADVSLPSAKWVGADSPYSQVVQIAGVTENSQVDLTPDVEQLAIFHEKDLAFVTENVGGVVTVYAVGQKPANDYTIQATIKEVYV